MSTKPTYIYGSALEGRQEVELALSSYLHGDGLRVDMRSVEPGGYTYPYAELTADCPLADLASPFHAPIDIEHLGSMDVNAFLLEYGLAKMTGELLRRGRMAFPVYEFDARKLAEADPQGFKGYLRAVGLEDWQIEGGTVEDLAGMAKARFLEKMEEGPELPFGGGSPTGSFEQMLEVLEDCELPEEGDGESLEDAKRRAKERVEDKNVGHSKRVISKPSPDMGL